MLRRGVSDLSEDASSRPLSFAINRFLAPRLLEAWIKIRFDNQVADRCLTTIARRDRLGSRDRRRLAEAIFKALRRRGSVDALMGTKAGKQEHSPQWLATALEQDWPDGPKALLFQENESPEQAGNLPPLVIRQLESSSLDLLELGRALRHRAPVTLRCKPNHRSRLALELRDHGVQTHFTPYSPNGLICEDGAQLHQLESGLRATFEVQDEGSQLLAMLVGASADERVLDACAGAGGKTLAMVDSRAQITASDIDDERLARLSNRLGTKDTNVTIQNLSSAHASVHEQTFDRILIDAPCSGTGTARRAPDLLWRLTAEHLTKYTTIQQTLLRRYADWVRPGGYLIYGTCSLLPQENEDQITEFLAQRQDFKRVAIAQTMGEHLAQQLGCTDYLQLLPHRHKTDGFFGCLMQRL